jgi:hypothetical protein
MLNNACVVVENECAVDNALQKNPVLMENFKNILSVFIPSRVFAPFTTKDISEMEKIKSLIEQDMIDAIKREYILKRLIKADKHSSAHIVEMFCSRGLRKTVTAYLHLFALVCEVIALKEKDLEKL